MTVLVFTKSTVKIKTEIAGKIQFYLKMESYSNRDRFIKGLGRTWMHFLSFSHRKIGLFKKKWHPYVKILDYQTSCYQVEPFLCNIIIVV